MQVSILYANFGWTFNNHYEAIGQILSLLCECVKNLYRGADHDFQIIITIRRPTSK